MVHSVANWTMGNVIVLFFSMEIFRVVLGDVPPGGIEGLWISDLSLKDKVKDDSYLWMRSAISRVQCALECTADTRCLSHFYRETSTTCIAQDTDLDSITVRNSSGYLAYGFLSSPGCRAPFVYNRAANLCFWFSDTKGNLTTAQQVCGSYGGSLVTIDTDAKRNAILTDPNFGKSPTGQSVPSYLVDGSDEGHEMDFRYKDGSPVPASFWLGSYPQNKTTENCIHLPTWSDGKLFHYDCDNSGYYFICQKP
ncbi:echinoidin-like isoform X2 [Crassostrea virginica]